MMFELIYHENKARIRLFPNGEQEQRFLGSLRGYSEISVLYDWIGHPSNDRAKSMLISCSPPSPPSPQEGGE